MRRMQRQTEDAFSFTPLIDIAFLLLIFFMCMPFKGLDFKLQSHLPKEGQSPWHQEAKETVKIRVRLKGDDLVYALGQHAAPTAQGLDPVIRALGPAYAYEIDSGAAVPWQGVVDAVNVLAAARCEDIRFRGGPPLTAEMRRR